MKKGIIFLIGAYVLYEFLIKPKSTVNVAPSPPPTINEVAEKIDRELGKQDKGEKGVTAGNLSKEQKANILLAGTEGKDIYKVIEEPPKKEVELPPGVLYRDGNGLMLLQQGNNYIMTNTGQQTYKIFYYRIPFKSHTPDNILVPNGSPISGTLSGSWITIVVNDKALVHLYEGKPEKVKICTQVPNKKRARCRKKYRNAYL